jgi:ABC-type transport system involved in multi-copper enzyme maturation permease subunit
VLNVSVFLYQYQDVTQKYEMNESMNQQNLLYESNREAKTLPKIVYYQQKIHNRPSNLSFISTTAEGIVPDGVSMKMLVEPDFETFSQYNPHINPFLSIDWTTLMIYVISFLCICFSYNAFSGEREDGTLKFMLSNSLSRTSVIIAKYFGLLVVFIIPILTGILLSCLIFELSPVIRLELADYTKIGWFFFVSVLMISFTILLGFFVSSITKNSYVSLIICLLSWTLMAIVLPNISWIISSQVDKIPTATAISLEEEQQKAALEDCYMGWPGNKATEQNAKDRKDCIDRRTAIHNSLFSNHHNRQMAQTSHAIEISKISPFGLFRFLGDKISGHNYHGYIHFFKQVKDYQLIYREYVVAKDKADNESRHLLWNESDWFIRNFMSRQQIVPDEVPQFTPSPQTFRELVSDTIVDITILFCWVIGLFVASFVSFIRYDVR